MTPEELLALTPEQCTNLKLYVYPTNCTNCTNCMYCMDCTDCTDCTDCMYCMDCTNCIGIKNGRNLKFIAWGVQLTKEQWKALKTKVDE